MALVLGVAQATLGVRAAQTFEADVCVYGGTSGGVVAAVQAARMGKRVDAGRAGAASGRHDRRRA